MNKAQLIEAIHDHVNEDARVDCTKRQIEAMLNSMGTVVEDAIASDEEVTLPLIGKFSQGQRAARQGRNPQTGESIQISASKVAKFKPAKSLRDAINP